MKKLWVEHYFFFFLGATRVLAAKSADNMRMFWRGHCASSMTTLPHTWCNLAQVSLPESHVFRPSARIFAFVFARGACACGANSAEKLCKLRRKHCMSSLATALHTRSNLAQIRRRNRTSFQVHASGTRAFLHFFCATRARARRKICRKHAHVLARTMRVIGENAAAHAVQP